MSLFSQKSFVEILHLIGNRTNFQITFLIVTIIAMGNLNAFVDTVFHPDIPYFDREHFIVGGTTAIVSAVLFGLLIFYIRHLNNALNTIRTLEKFLPICTNCKKIRKLNTDPRKIESWQPIEVYVAENTASQFTHSICPQCMSELYPGINIKLE